MRSQRRFCLDTVLTAFPALAQPAGDQGKRLDRDRRIGQRLDRLRQLGIESARQRATQIETMIADFERIGTVLEADIHAEQDRTKVHDPAHFAYSTSAQAMTQRRDNLMRSIAELKRQLTDAKVALDPRP